jgi:hypothetical protein
MRLLYDDRLYPITSVIGFIATGPAAAAQAYVDWMTPIQAARNVSLQTKTLSGPLDHVLYTLQPLTSVERRRFVFVPTDSHWTAFFDSGFQGSDAFSALSYLSKVLEVQSCSVTAVLEDDQHPPPAGRYGALGLEMYEPHDTDFLNYGRTIQLADDDGQWVFTARGTPFPFEDLQQYNKRKVRDRFTLELLADYLHHLGVRAFDEDFYRTSPDRPAIFIEKKGPVAPNLREYSLEEVQLRA